MIGLAAGLLFLPEKENYVQVNAEDLMWEAAQPTNSFTVDQVATMIIEGDPQLLLVDVRDPYDFFDFSIKNSVNIPLMDLLSDEYAGYLGIEDMNTVFYANDNVMADQAWIIASRLGYKNMYIMTGGLNEWMNCIINPTMPDAAQPATAFEQYEFRKGASMYFTGATQIEPSTSKTSVKVVRRKKGTTAVAGGC